MRDAGVVGVTRTSSTPSSAGCAINDAGELGVLQIDFKIFLENSEFSKSIFKTFSVNSELRGSIFKTFSVNSELRGSIFKTFP